jgi:hypothetical protein
LGTYRRRIERDPGRRHGRRTVAYASPERATEDKLFHGGGSVALSAKSSCITASSYHNHDTACVSNHCSAADLSAVGSNATTGALTGDGGATTIGGGASCGIMAPSACSELPPASPSIDGRLLPTLSSSILSSSPPLLPLANRLDAARCSRALSRPRRMPSSVFAAVSS